MQRYLFKELRLMAKEQGCKGWGFMNKDELCSAVGVVRLEHETKFILTNTKTLEETKWRNVNHISKGLKVNPGSVFYALKKGNMLNVKGVKYEMKKVRD